VVGGRPSSYKFTDQLIRGDRYVDRSTVIGSTAVVGKMSLLCAVWLLRYPLRKRTCMTAIDMIG
jgi:hypothetical protein